MGLEKFLTSMVHFHHTHFKYVPVDELWLGFPATKLKTWSSNWDWFWVKGWSWIRVVVAVAQVMEIRLAMKRVEVSLEIWVLGRWVVVEVGDRGGGSWGSRFADASWPEMMEVGGRWNNWRRIRFIFFYIFNLLDVF